MRTCSARSWRSGDRVSLVSSCGVDDMCRTHHAGPGLVSDEGVAQHLRQFARPEGKMGSLAAQSSDTLLARESLINPHQHHHPHLKRQQ